MTDTPKRLCGPSALTTGAVTQYTVPAATTTIIRSIHVMNTSASTGAAFSLSIGVFGAGTALFSAYTLAGQGILDWSGFIVLSAAEVIQALGVPATLTLTISGIEVS